MNLKRNALVIGVSGHVSVAILKALNNANFSGLKIYGACVNNQAAGFALSDEALLCPPANSITFPAWLKDTVEKHDIHLVISGVEEVNHALAQLKAQQGNALYLAPELDNIQRFNDKLTTMQWFQQIGIAHPRTVDLDDPHAVASIKTTLNFPVIVKPKRGKGSHGVATVADASGLKHYSDAHNYIAQELIGTAETEYTCGVYKSKFGYTKIIVMRRTLKHGSTAIAEVVRNDAIEAYCQHIAQHITTTAPFNIQLRLSADNTPLCFEINMRLSGTTAMRHQFGFKDCEAWIREQLFDQESSALFAVVPGVAIRYEEEAYFKSGSLDSLSLDTPRNVRKELMQ